MRRLLRHPGMLGSVLLSPFILFIQLSAASMAALSVIGVSGFAVAAREANSSRMSSPATGSFSGMPSGRVAAVMLMTDTGGTNGSVRGLCRPIPLRPVPETGS